MNPHEMFKASLETTTIVKRRRTSLYTFGVTRLPYVFVSRSEIDPRDTVVREGRVMVEKPHILIPGYNPLFEGFDLEGETPLSGEDIKYILMARRIQLPSLRYINADARLAVEQVSLDVKVGDVCNRLEGRNDTQTGVIRGEDRFFPFPLLMYVAEMIQRSAGDNLTEFLERQGGPSS
ncbi:MAG: hypothetical protein ABIF71_03995 [Planctomycetota bacterium]